VTTIAGGPRRAVSRVGYLALLLLVLLGVALMGVSEPGGFRRPQGAGGNSAGGQWASTCGGPQPVPHRRAACGWADYAEAPQSGRGTPRGTDRLLPACPVGDRLPCHPATRADRMPLPAGQHRAANRARNRPRHQPVTATRSSTILPRR